MTVSGAGRVRGRVRTRAREVPGGRNPLLVIDYIEAGDGESHARPDRGHDQKVRTSERGVLQGKGQSQGGRWEDPRGMPRAQVQGGRGDPPDQPDCGGGQRHGPRGPDQGPTGDRLLDAGQGEEGAPLRAPGAQERRREGGHAHRPRAVRTASHRPHQGLHSQRRVRQEVRRGPGPEVRGHEPREDRPRRVRHDPGGPGLAGSQVQQDLHPVGEVRDVLRLHQEAPGDGQGVRLHLRRRPLEGPQGAQAGMPLPRPPPGGAAGKVRQVPGRRVRGGQGRRGGQDRPQPPQPRREGLRRPQARVPSPPQDRRQVRRVPDDEPLRGHRRPRDGHDPRHPREGPPEQHPPPGVHLRLLRLEEARVLPLRARQHPRHRPEDLHHQGRDPERDVLRMGRRQDRDRPRHGAQGWSAGASGPRPSAGTGSRPA